MYKAANQSTSSPVVPQVNTRHGPNSSSLTSGQSSENPQGPSGDRVSIGDASPRRGLTFIKDAISRIGSKMPGHASTARGPEVHATPTSVKLATQQPAGVVNIANKKAGAGKELMQPRRSGGRYRNEGEGNPVLTHQKQAFQIGWKTLVSRNPYNAPNETLDRVPPWMPTMGCRRNGSGMHRSSYSAEDTTS